MPDGCSTRWQAKFPLLVIAYPAATLSVAQLFHYAAEVDTDFNDLSGGRRE